MQPDEITDLPYLFNTNPTHFTSTQYSTSFTNNIVPTYQFNGFPNNPLHELNTITPHQVVQQLSLSSNSTSDEADDQQQLSVINERKRRRMLSNRESARRSRMRKQKHLDVLWSQVVCLRNENERLVERLNQASESHDRVVQENGQLKEVTSELRRMITDMKLNYSPFPSLAELEDDDFCNDLE